MSAAKHTAVVVVFPGQGSQKPGMGSSFAAHPAYQAHLAQADALMGFELSQLIADGPQEELTRTEIAQPALLTVATGIYQVWRETHDRLPAAVAGHSLGEYAALVAAEVLSFEAALGLVSLRGQLMQQACAQQAGGMAAVIKPDIAAIEALCRDSQQRVVIANHNSPQQVVLSGEQTALEAILSEIKSARLGRAVPLKVSGAFHSYLMEPARQALAEAIAATVFYEPRMPVVMNVTAQATTSASEIRAWLSLQITAPVLWQASVMTLADHSPDFIELGSATLAPLIRQILPEAQLQSISDWQRLIDPAN